MRLRPRDTDALPDGFEAALHRAFLEAPQQATEERHLAMIEAADAGARVAAADPFTPARSAEPRRGDRSARLRVAATFAVVVLALPVAFAGLALAGVSLPEPVDSAFKTVGIDLPNQPDRADDDADRAGDRDEGSAGGGAVGDDPGSSEESDVEGGGSTGANRADGGKATDSQGKPSRTDDGRPVHAQDGQTGAPAHSEQGGQGVGTPPPHAQDGVGGPPPQAQDGGSEKSESVTPAPPAPKPVKPTPEPD